VEEWLKWSETKWDVRVLVDMNVLPLPVHYVVRYFIPKEVKGLRHRLGDIVDALSFSFVRRICTLTDSVIFFILWISQ
jgi:hypothetical protein